MDLSLIAAAGFDWAWYGYLAAGILGLGLVILIHEFGHFAAAKLCGVRVEQFFIGFGPRLWSFHWGETEYGLRVLPLGGFVSMFGQTDNPGKQSEEAERARVGTSVVDEHGEQLMRKGDDGRIVWHPRSYPAQTVPERMLIISAGVILNTITAFFFASIAYLIGTEFPPAVVYEIAPGSPAWEQDIHSGDEFTVIADVRKPRWDVDLRSRVVLADLEKGLPSRVKRDGREFDLLLKPRKERPDRTPTIGVLPPRSTRLATISRATPNNPDRIPAHYGTPAFLASPKFQSGDEVVAINGEPIKTYTDVIRAETRHAAEILTVVVRRREQPTAGEVPVEKELSIEVRQNPMRDLGIVMQLGPVKSVQDNSPAKQAGIAPGDLLKSIDVEPLGDPLTLPERLRRRQQTEPDKAWNIVVDRTVDGKTEEKRFTIKPREANWYELALRESSPVSIPTLGIAYTVLPTVTAIDPDGPAAKSGIAPGDVLVKAQLIPEQKPLPDGKIPATDTIEFVEEFDRTNWPFVILTGLQFKNPGTTVKLEFKGDKTVDLTPRETPGMFYPQRGLAFDVPMVERKADTLSQALQFAWTDTRDSMTQVYRFLHAMWIGQIPANNVGGIITIAQQAGDSASGGTAKWLLFLMMLSCNLAVLNFLPFPVLDGGHMVFLLYEGIFRRPPPERLHGWLTILGFVCLVGLMLFALANDIIRITR